MTALAAERSWPAQCPGPQRSGCIFNIHIDCRIAHGVCLLCADGDLSGQQRQRIAGSEPGAPSITWANPADITYGTPLSGTQLNATASVSGAFVYVPPAGTILNAGNGQTLSAVFTPADPIDFATVTPSVHINVLKATPTIVWNNPADITYPTALSSAQLNAIALPPASSLTGWWTGDGDATDAVAGNNGTVQGGATFTTGEVNQAFSFPDASGDGVTIVYNSGYDLNAPGFTASFWMQGSQNGNGMETVIEKSYPLGGSTGWAFQVNSSTGQSAIRHWRRLVHSSYFHGQCS